MSDELICHCDTYNFPHRIFSGKCEGLNPDDEECEHGCRISDGFFCPICELESAGCDKYHALKDEGLI
jgi:hypothetical protein